MPEGHTIHRLARDLNRDTRGHVVAASSPQGRFEDGAGRIDGRKLDGWEAWGKHLFGHIDSGEVLHIHLGLIGKLRRVKEPVPEPRGAVRLRIEGPKAAWDLRGPMRCAVGPPEMQAEAIAKLGPDPLQPDADAQRFVDALSRRRKAIGAVLLDQNVIAGIGNVYRAELLFLMGIDPRRPANSIDEETALELWDLTVAELTAGEKLNRIVTVQPDEVGASSRAKIAAGDRLYVYKREGQPCRRCGTEITVFEMGGRRIAACEKDQT